MRELTVVLDVGIRSARPAAPPAAGPRRRGVYIYIIYEPTNLKRGHTQQSSGAPHSARLVPHSGMHAKRRRLRQGHQRYRSTVSLDPCSRLRASASHACARCTGVYSCTHAHGVSRRCERSTSAYSRVRRTRLPPSFQDGTFHCARCPCNSGRRNNTRQCSVMGHLPKHLPAVLSRTAGVASQAGVTVHPTCQAIRRSRSRTHVLCI